MRRRRLALRQIAETTQDVSDIDGDDSDAQQQEQSVAEPTFNLLTVTAGPGLQPTAILLSDDDDDEDGHDQALLPHERTAVPSPNNVKPTKKQSHREKESARDKTGGSNSSIFNLYQEGLASDQVLQLAFTRRRAPRSLRMTDIKPGDDFVLPLPPLRIADLLPSTNVNIRDLFPTNDVLLSPSPSLLSSSLSNMSEVASDSALQVPSHGASSHAITSAKKFFFTPEDASLTERRSWESISESEWNQLYQDLQKEELVAVTRGRSKPKSTQQHQAKIPSVDSVGLLLRDCRSDALAHFVWETLLLPVLENQHHEVLDDRDIRTQELLRLLLRQSYFRAMAPKDFRTKVRAKQFRQQLSDAALGAQVELQLLTLYHSNRQSL